MRFNHQVCDSELYKLRKELRQSELDRDTLARTHAKQLAKLSRDHAHVVTELTDKIIELTGGPVGLNIKDTRQQQKDDGFVSLEEAPPEEVRDTFLNSN